MLTRTTGAYFSNYFFPPIELKENFLDFSESYGKLLALKHFHKYFGSLLYRFTWIMDYRAVFVLSFM